MEYNTKHMLRFKDRRPKESFFAGRMPLSLSLLQTNSTMTSSCWTLTVYCVENLLDEEIKWHTIQQMSFSGYILLS